MTDYNGILCEEEKSCSNSSSIGPSHFVKSDFELQKIDYEERKQFEKLTSMMLIEIFNKIVSISDTQGVMCDTLSFIIQSIEELKKKIL